MPVAELEPTVGNRRPSDLAIIGADLADSLTIARQRNHFAEAQDPSQWAGRHGLSGRSWLRNAHCRLEPIP